MGQMTSLPADAADARSFHFHMLQRMEGADCNTISEFHSTSITRLLTIQNHACLVTGLTAYCT